MATLAEIKTYMHAEGESDAAVEPFVAAARAFLAGAGVREGAVRSDAYDLALKALSLHWYDNRDGAPVPEGLQQLINQLQYAKVSEAASDSDTGEAGA